MNYNYTSAKEWINDGCPVQPIRGKKEYNNASKIYEDATAMSDPAINQSALNELSSALDYAGERHWTFKWQIILGAIVSVALLYWLSGSKEEDIAEQATLVETVKTWQEGDTVIPMTAFKNTNNIVSDLYAVRYESPAKFKAYNLYKIGTGYYNHEEVIKVYERDAQNSSDPEVRERNRKRAEEKKANLPQAQKESKEQYDKLSAMSFAELQEMALGEVETKLSVEASSGRTVKFWLWFLGICIPLYVFACRPYGYTINKYTAEAKTLNAIQRIGLWVSGGLAAGAAALQFTTIITKWSDGTTTKSDDGMGPAIAVAKIALLVAALLVFCFTCSFIMAYATIAGLIRNYDWAKIFASGKSKLASATAK